MLLPKDIQFGQPISGLPQKDRPGSYGIILNANGQLALVSVNNSPYFFPGGGIDAGENPVMALHREVMEETGLLIEVMDYLGTMNDWIFRKSEQINVNRIGHYYLAHYMEERPLGKVEDDHQLHWAKPKIAIASMHDPSQSWLLNQLFFSDEGQNFLETSLSAVNQATKG
ncbi:MAG TPA: NUDIX domain-containing protein [Saprospiraceae bacterium]|nr:NUDIX domain-containing protein [Saprospiraceae bacterium]HMQ81677.1 NUDIX domain-containing protein [Saprospiraceae bacterium]